MKGSKKKQTAAEPKTQGVRYRVLRSERLERKVPASRRVQREQASWRGTRLEDRSLLHRRVNVSYGRLRRMRNDEGEGKKKKDATRVDGLRIVRFDF